ncbi:transcriptional regulator with XRE-family HTH domain [Salinibacter ruber]|uniref:helix-turn-helix domain-containing protein n=1 Tax=Salinibacter ruber TaxID=146919 RepID=UPI002168A897|nr:helix-turn-helix transcriptional regulator [Salinibacter ruber]MCS3830864.1 transcriptional regulator with XRE-family HTH domain [Salinibacter ruber]
MSDFGDQVRKRRKADGLSQEKLAEQAGISRTYLSEIERGEAENISFRVVENLKEVLGIGDDAPEDLPEGLEEFAEEEDLPPRDVEALASVELRGERPEDKQEWKVLYNLIRSYLDNK